MLTKQLRRLVPDRWIAAELDRLLPSFAGPDQAVAADLAADLAWVGGDVKRWCDLINDHLHLNSSQPAGCLTDHAYEVALGLLQRAHDYLEREGHPPSRRHWLDLYAVTPAAG